MKSENLRTLPLKELQDIDWNSISVQQAADLGSVFDAFNDELNDIEKHTHYLRMTEVSAIAGLLAAAIMYLVFDKELTLVCTCLAFASVYAYGMRDLIVANRRAERARNNIEECVKNYPRLKA